MYVETLLERVRRKLNPANPTRMAAMPAIRMAAAVIQVLVRLAVSVPPPVKERLLWAALASLRAFW